MKHANRLKHVNRGWLAATVVATALLAGCGGSGSGTPVVETDVPASVGNSVAAMVDYITNLFAQTSDTTEPLNVNAVTLAVDDTVEPSKLP